MARRKFISFQRLKVILRRQEIPRWGADYDPAIHATREEAPGMSWAAQVPSEKLGRTVHLLSSAETAIYFLAAYHPRLFDLHEQRMLPMVPTSHPLAGHPLAAGLALPPFKGTLDVVKRLGRTHPAVTAEVDGTQFRPPFPYIGDQLLFLEDDQGPYCVNWTCKDRMESFNQRRPDDPIPKDPEKSKAYAQFRFAMERTLYSDAGIRTHAATKEEIPRRLLHNLRILYSSTMKPIPYAQRRRRDLVEEFRSCIDSGVPPNEIILRRTRGSLEETERMETLFFQAVFRREIRVELSEPIFTCKPLIRERSDVLKLFDHWFRRNA